MWKIRASIISLALLASCFTFQPNQASAASQLITCTDLSTGKTVVLMAPLKDCRAYQAKSFWQLKSPDIKNAPIAKIAAIKVCTSKRTEFTYQIIKSQCAKYQNTNLFQREVKVPAAPVIQSASPRDDDGIQITLVIDNNEKLSSPITYYIVTNLVTNLSEKIWIRNQNTIYIGGLSASTLYKFKIASVNADGISTASSDSPEVKTAQLPQASVTPVFSPRYSVGDSGPGGGIIFYVASTPFASPGSACNTTCRYLEVAPSTWQNGVIEEDLSYTWSLNTSVATEQDRTTPGTEGRVSERSIEKANWRIGAGLNNTRVMKVSGAQSDAQAAVLAYGGNDSSVGQWFIPSLNEINELCKFTRGQSSGDPSVACTNDGAVNNSTLLNPAAGGFGEAIYWTSSERDASRAWLFNLRGGRGAQSSNKFFDIQIRPIRAL